jgi:peptidoglycan/LPS O-acetylase OafA/YrhL
MTIKRFFVILSIVLAVLTIPFIAMQFSTEVDWDIFDFIVMGILLLGTGLLIELVLRKVQTLKNRLILCGAVLFLFLIIWAELAVGIFGSPFAGS